MVYLSGGSNCKRPCNFHVPGPEKASLIMSEGWLRRVLPES
jgi:hypothetical protein